MMIGIKIYKRLLYGGISNVQSVVDKLPTPDYSEPELSQMQLKTE